MLDAGGGIGGELGESVGPARIAERALPKMRSTPLTPEMQKAAVLSSLKSTDLPVDLMKEALLPTADGSKGKPSAVITKEEQVAHTAALEEGLKKLGVDPKAETSLIDEKKSFLRNLIDFSGTGGKIKASLLAILAPLIMMIKKALGDNSVRGTGTA